MRADLSQLGQCVFPDVFVCTVVRHSSASTEAIMSFCITGATLTGCTWCKVGL